MINVLIFDADGVTIDSVGKFSERLEKEYGISKGKTSVFFNGVFLDCLIGKADLKNEIPPFLQKWGWKQSVDDFLHYWFKSEHSINHNLVEELKILKKKGLNLYLATNQEAYRTGYIMEDMGFKHIFNDVFSSAYLGHKKPQKEFFQSIMDQLPGIQKKEILFWDDTQGHIQVARVFGWNAELYTTCTDFKKKMTQYL